MVNIMPLDWSTVNPAIMLTFPAILARIRSWQHLGLVRPRRCRRAWWIVGWLGNSRRTPARRTASIWTPSGAGARSMPRCHSPSTPPPSSRSVPRGTPRGIATRPCDVGGHRCRRCSVSPSDTESLPATRSTASSVRSTRPSVRRLPRCSASMPSMPASRWRPRSIRGSMPWCRCSSATASSSAKHSPSTSTTSPDAPRGTTVTVRRNGDSHRVVLDETSARAVRRCAGRRNGEPLFISDHRAASPARID